MKSSKQRKTLYALLLSMATLSGAGFASCAAAADFPFAAAWAPDIARSAADVGVVQVAPSAAPARDGIATIGRATTGRSLSRRMPLPRPRPRHRQAANTGVFSSVAIALGKIPVAERLQPAEREMRAHTIGDCSAARCPVLEGRLADAIRAAKGHGFSARIRTINETVNRLVSYRPDSDNYNRRDHWATPRQTLQRGAGDCEDFAILKMASLRALGIPDASMSLVVLHDDGRDLYHAVLAIKTDQGFFILDNLRDRVVLDTELPHYTPLFSISAGRGYMHARRMDDAGSVVVATSLGSVSPGEGRISAGNAASGSGGSSMPR